MLSLVSTFKSGTFMAKTVECPIVDVSDAQPSDVQQNEFEKLLRDQIVPRARVVILRNDYSVEFVLNVSVVGERGDLMAMDAAQTSAMEIATIANDYKVARVDNSTLKPLRKFFRIGVAEV